MKFAFINQESETLDIKTIDGNNSYNVIREIVGGLLEVLNLPEGFKERKIIAYINEEGKLSSQFKPTLCLNHDGVVFDIVHGNIVFVKYDYEEDKEYPLSDEDIEFILNKINENFAMIIMEGEPLLLPSFHY